MNYLFKRRLTPFLLLLTVLALTACQMVAQPAATSKATPVAPAPSTASMTAGTLRSALDQLLGEHVLLAASATNAALHGRDADFKAAAASLDGNSQDLAATIGAVYGNAAGKAFLPLWRKHIGFFVDYTNAVAKQDQAGKDKAIADLTQYAQDFGAFLESANPNLPQAAVVSLLVPHVKTLTAVIDAQAAHDPATAYLALRTAYAHMPMVANALTDGIIKQFPDKFGAAAMAQPGATAAMTDTMTMTGTPAMTGTGSMTGTGMMTGTASTSLPVMIKTFMFMPERIEVPVGGTIVWTNQDAINHTVTSGTPEKPDSVFDSGPFNKGAQFSFTFTKVGEYPYFCGRHNEMRGVIVVTPAQ